MREENSCIDALMMNYPKRIEIIVKSVTDDDRITVDEGVKGFAYRR